MAIYKTKYKMSGKSIDPMASSVRNSRKPNMVLGNKIFDQGMLAYIYPFIIGIDIHRFHKTATREPYYVKMQSTKYKNVIDDLDTVT